MVSMVAEGIINTFLVEIYETKVDFGRTFFFYIYKYISQILFKYKMSQIHL